MFKLKYVNVLALLLVAFVGLFFLGRISVNSTDTKLDLGVTLLTVSLIWAFAGWQYSRFRLDRFERFFTEYFDDTLVQGRVDKILGNYARRLQQRFTAEEAANAALKKNLRDDDLQEASVGATAVAQHAKRRYWSLHKLAKSCRHLFTLELKPSFKDYLS